MSTAHAVLGVDIGTTSAKALVLDVTGVVLGQSSRRLAIVRGPGGVVEQDMEEVWHAAAQAIGSALALAGFPPVAAVGLSGQGDGAWFVDEDSVPLAPAATWMDGRAEDVVARWRRDGRAAQVEQASGTALFAGCLLPLAAWTADQEPSVARRVRWHLNCKDWVRFRLTGTVGTDPTEASRTAYATAAWDGTGPLSYDHDLLDALGLDWLSPALAPISPSSRIVGEVVGVAAAATGLRPGTPVVTGLLDGSAAPLGLRVSEPGEGFALIGTTASYGVVSAQMRPPPYASGFCVPRGVGPGWFVTEAPTSGAPTLEWARRLLLPGGTWPEFEDLARAAPEGSHGVLLLPHLSTGGERAPFVDPQARGSYVGLSSDTDRADLARAAYEGLALTMADCLSHLPPVHSIALGGGGGGALLAQVIADVTGTAVRMPEPMEFGAAGVASVAAAAVGIDGFRLPLGSDEVVEPQAATASLYASAFEAHRAAVRAAQPTWPALARLRASGRREDPEGSTT